MTGDKLRGHPIYYENDAWFYSDTKTQTSNSPRDCGYCGKSNTKEGYDGCLGIIHNAMNACCGHGNPEEAYIQRLDESIIRGERVMKLKNLFKKEVKERAADKLIKELPKKSWKQVIFILVLLLIAAEYNLDITGLL